ncbi:MAG: hypothetical protein GF384_05345 [Elusimicrobia bacterium]|nr:hypothetical protein [Elusimicrobiota bacterium]MBD3412208.1 hypothetical protein [Elusimicrobiota bacterium]
MNASLIVEIAMEIALTPELLDRLGSEASPVVARHAAMSTSVGGIGPLLRERIIGLAGLEQQVIGVTLLYDQVWIQRWQPWGQLYLEKVNIGHYVKSVLSRERDLTVRMYDGTSVPVTVWKASYGAASVYFLESPDITSVVYPGVEDAPPETTNKTVWYEDLRIRQSWLLGRGSLALVKSMQLRPAVIVLSETPTMFGWHALVNDEYKELEHCKNTRYVFNDHTPLEYAHPVWSIQRLKKLKIDPVFYSKLPRVGQGNDTVDITQMLVAGVDQVYGVAQIHGRVMRAMETLKPYGDKITTITNGVSIAFWQNPKYMNAEQLSDEELLQIKHEEKIRLIDWIWRRYKLSFSWKEEAVHKPIILWTRRITGYKRLDILTETVKQTHYRRRLVQSDVMILLGGRIHQQDGLSKLVVFELLDILNEHDDIGNRITMLDNYNIWEAPNLFRGIDATIMMSDQGKEASATGFMKAQVNGGLVIATRDGAIPETVLFQGGSDHRQSNGFEIAYVNGSPSPETFLKAIELFSQTYKDPAARVRMMRSSISMAPRISVERTAREMVALFNKGKTVVEEVKS